MGHIDQVIKSKHIFLQSLSVILQHFPFQPTFFSKFGSSINTFLILNKCLKLSQQQPTMMIKLTFAFFFHWLKCISRIKDYFRELGNLIS